MSKQLRNKVSTQELQTDAKARLIITYEGTSSLIAKL